MLAVLLGAIAWLAGCGSGDSGEAALPEADTTAERITRTVVASGLADPLYVTGRPGDDALYVVQQDGLVRAFRDGAEQDPLLDIRGVTRPGGEQGLLGLAFHPSHADNGRFYVNYTDGAGTTMVVEYEAPGGGQADPASARTLLSVEQPYANHNGGHLAFGPDGMLYIGLGDGGSGGDPENRAQDLGSLLGKMLRIDVDARDPGMEYGIPADNPFVDSPGARLEIWAWGLRNPWRYSFDPPTGRLWIGDVGQNEREEIDRVAAGATGGANFGWSRFEGTEVYDDSRELAVLPHVPPVATYGHDAGCSVTGGYVVRSDRLPALQGRYVYGDYCSGRVWSLDADSADAGEPRDITDTMGGPLDDLRSFGLDNDGALYAVAGDRVVRLEQG